MITLNNPLDQEFVAKGIKQTAVHISANKSFKEAKSELDADTKERFGKDHGINFKLLAEAYLKDNKAKEAAEKTLQAWEEAVEIESGLKHITDTGRSVADIADEYMEVK